MQKIADLHCFLTNILIHSQASGALPDAPPKWRFLDFAQIIAKDSRKFQNNFKKLQIFFKIIKNWKFFAKIFLIFNCILNTLWILLQRPQTPPTGRLKRRTSPSVVELYSPPNMFSAGANEWSLIMCYISGDWTEIFF